MPSRTPEPSFPGPEEPGAAPAFSGDETERYQRLGLLGQGGMGRVYLARDTRLDREVALKEVLHEGPDTEARLVREALLTAQLDHPGIVPVYDAGRTSEGRLFYTMRLVRGRRLGDLVREAPHLEARLRLVPHVLDVARALGFAHERDVVHRDLKPDNVLIGSRGETQLSDWGLARKLQPGAAPRSDLRPATPAPVDDSLTQQPGGVVGTLRYAAPEFVFGGAATLESDVYSLGATLLEVVTGAPPWASLAPEDVRARLTAGHALPTPLPVGTPPALATIIRRALAVDPHARYRAAGAMAEDLAALLDGRLVGTHPYGPRELLVHFLRTWRVPLLVGGVVLAFALVALTVSGAKARAERDRALAAERAVAGRTADLLLQRARDSDALGELPEVEYLAAQAAELQPGSPDALGALMAAGGPGPRLRAKVEVPRCRLGRPLSHGAVCLTDRGLAVLDDGGRVLREAALPSARTFVVDAAERYALALVGTGLWRVALETGHAEPWGPAPSYAIGLGLDPELGAAWAFNPAWMMLTSWTQTLELTPCAPRVELLGVLRAGDGLEFLCSDGAVRRATPFELMSAPVGPAPLALWRRPTVASVAPTLLAGATVVTVEDEHRRLVGTVRGAVVRVDLRLGTATMLTQREHLGPLRQVLVLDRALLLVGERGAPTLIDRETGRLLAVLPAWTRGLARHDGLDTVVFGEALSRWALADVGPSRVDAPVGLSSVSVAADGRTAMLAGADGFVAHWDLGAGRVVPVDLGLTQVVKSVALSPDGARALVGAVGLQGVFVHERATGRTVFHPAKPAARRVGWLADGTGWSMGYDLAPLLLRDGAWLERPAPRAQQWIDASSTVDGRGVVILDAEGGVLVATRSGLEPRESRPGAGEVAALGVDGPFFFAHGAEVRASTGASLELGERWGFVTALALSPDGRWLAVGTSTGGLLLADPGRLEVRARASLHRERVSEVSFSRAGTLLTASWDRTVRAWTLAPLDVTPPAQGVAARWGFPHVPR